MQLSCIQTSQLLLFKMTRKFIRICVIRNSTALSTQSVHLDADVISIETSRSHGEIISAFENNTYDKEIGLGVYDIHSPRVPSKEEMKQNINRALKRLNHPNFGLIRTVA